jgi:ankyrin repeat protein
MADAMELSKQVYRICDTKTDPSTELRAFLDAHPQVSVTKYRSRDGRQALHRASERGHAACVRMLLDQGADVHARDDCEWTALILTSITGKLECMQILIEAKADVNASNMYGQTAAHYAPNHAHTKCLQLLIDNHADVNVRDKRGDTPAMGACIKGKDLPCLQLLLDNKADLSVRGNGGRDALCYAMKEAASMYTSGMVFPVFCCNTDAKNVKIGGKYGVTEALVAACIKEYKHVQTYIDEYHRALKKTLSDEVEVDAHVGRGGKGIYQEPLERVLEYMGLSMHKDQVVNASIDGGGTKRALLPFHVLNAKVWYNKYRRE